MTTSRESPADDSKPASQSPLLNALFKIPSHLYQASILSASYFRQSIYKNPPIKEPQELRRQFLQAVVDDEIKTVKQILDKKPAFLLDKSKEDLVIESQYTWEKLNLKGENALTIAAKRRQIEVLETLMPYVEKLQDQKLAEETKADVLSKWPSYEHKEKKDEWNIPAEYIAELEKMIEVFKNETFPSGTEVGAKLSEKTELALQQFIDKILPDKAVTLDESIQAELFLYAAYKVYHDHFDDLQDEDKRTAYCTRIIGFSQSRLTRNDMKPWCEGIHNVVEEQRPIGEPAQKLKLVTGKHFYRSGRLDFSELGGTFYFGIFSRCLEGIASTSKAHVIFKKLCQAKTEALQKLCISQTIRPTL
jgi:hypothetical protein